MRKSAKTRFRITIPRLVRGLAIVFLSTIVLSSAAVAVVIDGVAIIVNKDAILVSQINETLMPFMQEYRTKYSGAELKKKMDELRQTVIEQAIETKLILQVAKQKGIVPDERDVDVRIEMVKSRFPSEDVFLEGLAAKGITYREYRDQVAEQVLVQDTIKLVAGSDINISENEIRDFYDAHLSEFVTEPKVKLAQIFLKIPTDSTPEQVEELRQKAEQLHILIEDGMAFSELARTYSEGPYREKDGVIGVVGHGEILPELEDIAFGLQTGEMSPVIQTTYGLHVLKSLESFPARKITLDEARPLIEDRITETKRSEKYKEWIKKLREDAFIEVKI
ncbi:MAG: hypothetical protein C4532_13980 [Candidatus Abyssobacteria bacterium SURF_17]|uniref:PpiC domain-containing protein n=1 Tax=Candidatus Abyssobacteria bacterium SURF_17 TaxID=2093361 RepID=A0A419EUG3_9BACT|nr:MAG: hypothetical protein C4532_13980 [Candidatus Abyssubacteria bacterium SURF_17]